MSDIFKNVTIRDINHAMYNNGMPTGKKTCNSNGTRYTMNRVRKTSVRIKNKKIIDHRRK